MNDGRGVGAGGWIPEEPDELDRVNAECERRAAIERVRRLAGGEVER